MSSTETLDLSIIIPFKNKSTLTIACIESLVKYAPNISEVLIISNSSTKEELNKVDVAVKKHKRYKLLEHNTPFNFQEINNWGIRNTKGRVVMLLNNDIELTQSSIGLIDKMYQEAIRPKVGAVGCVLVYEDRKTVQHAGVHFVPGGTADHLFIGKSLNYIKNQTNIDIKEGLETTAVTAAAVMIERSKLKSINNMNEDFIICGGDVDLCLRLKEKGFKTWLVGLNYGYMIHKESKSRSMISVPYVDFVESYRSYIKHFDFMNGDKYIHQKDVTNAK